VNDRALHDPGGRVGELDADRKPIPIREKSHRGAVRAERQADIQPAAVLALDQQGRSRVGAESHGEWQRDAPLRVFGDAADTVADEPWNDVARAEVRVARVENDRLALLQGVIERA